MGLEIIIYIIVFAASSSSPDLRAWVIASLTLVCFIARVLTALWGRKVMDQAFVDPNLVPVYHPAAMVPSAFRSYK